MYQNRLREVRVVRRVTQFQLRLLSGVHQTKISMVENFLVKPTDEEKARLAGALGKMVEEVFPPAQGEVRP